MGNSVDTENILGIAIGMTYLISVASGVIVYCLRNSKMVTRKRIWFHIFFISISVFLTLPVVLISSSEKSLNWIVIGVAAAALAVVWTMVFAIEARYPIDWSRPFRFGAEAAEGRTLRLAARKLIEGGNLEPAERASLERAIAKSDSQIARAAKPGE